jgi:hypothetical protein
LRHSFIFRYVLYICDHHLSILYGRPSIVREDVTISGWEKLMKVPGFAESDKRLVSQMALLTMMSHVRELFGPDTGEPVPHAFAPQLTNYSRQIDQWMGYWTTELLSKTDLLSKDIKLTLAELHQHIGEFPTKGVILHHHLAKLHLHSHVFRGLKGAPVPPHFQDSAAAAVSAATFTVEMLLSDHDVRESLVGIPHYLHSMIAFASVFLLKVASQHSGQYIDETMAYDLTAKVVRQFRATSVGEWHLVHMMAEGLEKLVASRTTNPTTNPDQHLVPATSQASIALEYSPHMPSMAASNGFYEGDTSNNGLDDDFGLSTSNFLCIQPGELDSNFPAFGL